MRNICYSTQVNICKLIIVGTKTILSLNKLKIEKKPTRSQDYYYVD